MERLKGDKNSASSMQEINKYETWRITWIYDIKREEKSSKWFEEQREIQNVIDPRSTARVFPFSVLLLFWRPGAGASGLGRTDYVWLNRTFAANFCWLVLATRAGTGAPTPSVNMSDRSDPRSADLSVFWCQARAAADRGTIQTNIL